MRGVGGGVGGPPLRDHLWQGPPLPVTLRLIHPPPKMTQGVMTPLTPLHHLQQHPRAGSQGVGIATLIFRYFLRYFSSTNRTDLSRFRGTFHSFDPGWLCYFRYSYSSRRAVASRRASRHVQERARRARRAFRSECRLLGSLLVRRNDARGASPARLDRDRLQDQRQAHRL